ncbi:MAG: abortive infection family protein [Cytophaga sp.]|uniref:abortive infection family protein n=1 Tax=Cytophaga sp. TaxID=29535 RepID=UPI003F7F0CAE
MEDLDIKKIRKILSYKGRSDLSDLLRSSVSHLDESGSFGSRWYSILSTFNIKSPPSVQAKIDKLSHKDKEEIFKALLLVYPLKDNAPEITEIIYYPDFDIEITELVEAKELDRISFEYIHDQIKKCNAKIAEKDYDGAVTNARTLIESICLFILESKTKQKHEYDGNLIKLYKSVASLLKMSPGDYIDENLKQILSGVFSIINGVSGLRNIYSDSHGTSPSKISYKIDDRHAILTVNLAKTITEYLFLSYEKSQ